MDGDLVINDRITIPAGEMRYTFARSSGPGGQNVNKSNTKAVLRWNVARTRAISHDARGRFLKQYAARVNARGELLLSCEQHREQLANRRECQERLRQMVESVLVRPRRRIGTKPSRSSVERRLREKRAASDKKAQRRFRGGAG